MSGGHGLESLQGERDTRAHRAAAPVKVVATVWFILAVVVTPPRAIWAFGAYAVLVVAVTIAVRMPARTLVRRLAIEAPFVGFAVLLPLIGRGERVHVLGVPISVAGAWAALAILAKGTLGLAASVVLTWTTSVADLLAGLRRLGTPRILVVVAGFMVRYAAVVTDELHRLQIARISRGDDPRWFWQGRAVAATAGTLFVRSYERGERVQIAMVSRGFNGDFPDDPTSARGIDPRVLVVPVAATLVSAAAVVLA